MSGPDIYHRKHGRPVKSWTEGVPFDNNALEQAYNTASMPFIHSHVALMPDVHLGMGATIGSVVPTDGAVIPAAVGVDIGCGMMAVRTSIQSHELPDSLLKLRQRIEDTIPVGQGQHDYNTYKGYADMRIPSRTFRRVAKMRSRDNPAKKAALQMGTLGGGNHFIEICLDENEEVWMMLHSGSRGIGNMIGRAYIEQAKEDMRIHHINLPDRDLAYLSEGTTHFDEYVEAVGWAQDYAFNNRVAMMDTLRRIVEDEVRPFIAIGSAVNCHHNYVEKENHFGKNVWITRKGAVRAREGDLGIIPGSMGAKSFIVRGLGNPDSFHSCSHGAGRVMSRGAAKQNISVDEHIDATHGVECRKDKGMLDESPAAYKDIDAVMTAQSDLVEIVHTLKQIVCVKG
jgi:tRNA-splicing ligase RtcB